MLRSLLVIPLSIIAVAPTMLAQPSSVGDCLGVLHVHDYYSYAEQNNLTIDYLRSIDFQTFQEMKQSFSASQWAALPSGLFKGDEDYNSFDQKRTQYLENSHYNRTQSQALNILQITTSPRAYSAYDNCLEHLTQKGLLVWASKEDTQHIELHVKYVNPPRIKSMRITGLLSGGEVDAKYRGHLWPDRTAWGINEDKIVTITRRPGSSETTVVISTADDAYNFSHTYYRADGTLTLSYPGSTDVFRGVRTASATFPDNGGNKGHCTNEIGHKDGKWCTSRTTLTLTTTAPRFFTAPSVACLSWGCQWVASERGETVSPDGLTASGHIDNFGPSGTATLSARESEHVTKAQCGGDGPIPVILGQTVTFTTLKDCLGIAVINSVRFADNSQLVAHFGSQQPNSSPIQVESTLDIGDTQIGVYKMVQGSVPD